MNNCKISLLPLKCQKWQSYKSQQKLFLEGKLEDNENRVPSPRKSYEKDDIRINKDLLTYGNNHTSKLTKAQAEQFVQDWEVISYMPITDTGFSGTLFRAKQPIKDDKGNVIVEKDQFGHVFSQY